MKKIIDEGKNFLGIDYGTKVTGTALYLNGQYPYPMPHEKIIYKDDNSLIAKINEIIESELVDTAVLGIPYLTDGQETAQTQKIKDFGKLLEENLENCNLFYQDETLSTFEAKDRMKNSPKYNFKVDLKRIDCLAAAIILEDFLKKA